MPGNFVNVIGEIKEDRSVRLEKLTQINTADEEIVWFWNMMDVQKAILQRWASKSTNLKPVGAILQKKDYHIPHELIEAEEEKEY